MSRSSRRPLAATLGRTEDDRGGNGVCRAGARRGHPRDGGRRPSRPGRLPHVAALDADACPAWRDGDAPARRSATRSQRLRFEAIPDGISLLPRHSGRVDVYVNHETSKVPFPYVTAAPDGRQRGERLRQRAAEPPGPQPVRRGHVERRAGDRQQRGLPTVLLQLPRHPAEGFHRPHPVHQRGDAGLRLPTAKPRGRRSGEPRRSGKAASSWRWTSRRARTSDLRHGPSQPRELRRRSGVRRAGRALGRRHVHQRAAYPPLRCGCGAGAVAGLLLHRQDSQSLMKDEGNLWAFVSDTPGRERLLRRGPRIRAPRSRATSSRSPRTIATGLNADGTDSTPPTSAIPRRPTTAPGRPTCGSRPSTGIDGPQWVMEYWSDINNVFQFVRIEDIAYDKRPGMHNVVYLADSGRGAAPRPRASTPRTSARPTAGSGAWCSTSRTRRWSRP